MSCWYCRAAVGKSIRKRIHMVENAASNLAAQIEDTAPTNYKPLLDWVEETAELTQPDSVYWVNGSQEENDRIAQEMVDAGSLVRLTDPQFPNSYAAFSDPADVARVESRTFICSEKEEDAGFTNNWKDPAEMKAILNDAFAGSMRGRTMYVVPFVMGPLDAKEPKYGVEITDSPYVVLSMRVMARIGTDVLNKIAETEAFLSQPCTPLVPRWKTARKMIRCRQMAPSG